MKSTWLVFGLVAALALGVGGWFAYRWYTTPAIPDLPLDQMEKGVAEAVEEALQEVRRSPRSGPAWGRLALVLWANKYYVYAFPCLENAERFEPDNPRWPYLQAESLLRENHSEALIRFRRAVACAQESDLKEGALFRLAILLIGDDELAEGEHHLQELAELTGANDPQVKFGQALLALAREDHRAAAKDLLTLTQNPFCRKRAYQLLALASEDRELARIFQQKAFELPPDMDWPDPFLIELQEYTVSRAVRMQALGDLDRQGRLPEALALLKELARESPDSGVYLNLGRLLAKMNREDEAEDALRTSIRFDAKNSQAHTILAVVLLLKAESRAEQPDGKAAAAELFRQAVTASDDALAINARSPRAHLTRGRALKKLGKIEEGMEAMRQAILCAPELAEAHLELGETLAEQGQREKALEHLEYAVRLAGPAADAARKLLEKWRVKLQPAPE
jgi:tetratricopeptide (TPR) repeat protein